MPPIANALLGDQLYRFRSVTSVLLFDIAVCFY